MTSFRRQGNEMRYWHRSRNNHTNCLILSSLQYPKGRPRTFLYSSYLPDGIIVQGIVSIRQFWTGTSVRLFSFVDSFVVSFMPWSLSQAGVSKDLHEKLHDIGAFHSSQVRPTAKKRKFVKRVLATDPDTGWIMLKKQGAAKEWFCFLRSPLNTFSTYMHPGLDALPLCGCCSGDDAIPAHCWVPVLLETRNSLAGSPHAEMLCPDVVWSPWDVLWGDKARAFHRP